MTRVGLSSTVMAALLALPTGLSAQAGAAVLDDLTEPAAPASAVDITPTEVTALTAEQFGGTLLVTGAAAFGGQAPVLVGEDTTGNDGAILPALGTPMGLDISELFIHQPDPDVPELDFIVRVTQLDREPPPEIVRYLWRLDKIDGQEYWLQAKTSDVVGTGFADDPEGTLGHTSGSFRVRGDCGQVMVGDVQTPVSGCSHVAWLDGVFDPDANEIRMTLPLDSPDAPELTAGAVIFGHVEASFQAGVSNASTSDVAAFEDDYIIPSKQVLLGIAPAGTNPLFVEFNTPATVSEDGSFVGDLDIAALSPGSYEVHAKACFADNCGVRSAPVTIQ